MLDQAATQQGVPLRYLTPHLLRIRLKSKPDSITPPLVAPILQFVISDAPGLGAWSAELAAELDCLPLLLLRPRSPELAASAEHTAATHVDLLRTRNATVQHWLCSRAEVAAFPGLVLASCTLGFVDTSNESYVEALDRCLAASILQNIKVCTHAQ